jgi:hypothetical protein
MAMAVGAASAAKAQKAVEVSLALPDAPSSLMAAETMEMPQSAAAGAVPTKLPPCGRMNWSWRMPTPAGGTGPCAEDPLQMIVGTGNVAPLSSKQKAELAGRNIIDPFNLITITGYAGVYVAANAHSAYGPGFKGFGRLTGYSLAEDTQGELLGVYAIPSLVHEDPRYHRLPDKPVGIRILHALSHTVVSRHDNGTLMPNYATLGTYPISAALSDAYVPGIDTSGSAFAKRVALGYATDPAGALIAEFLPDVAKRIHVRVVFVQQILNNIATTKANQ